MVRLVIWDAITIIITSLQCMAWILQTIFPNLFLMMISLTYDIHVIVEEYPTSEHQLLIAMQTGSYLGNIALLILLWGESTGHRWIPLTGASDAERHRVMSSWHKNAFRSHDDVIKWKQLPHHWPFFPRTKASDAELWCFLWSAPE